MDAIGVVIIIAGMKVGIIMVLGSRSYPNPYSI